MFITDPSTLVITKSMNLLQYTADFTDDTIYILNKTLYLFQL